MFQENLIFAQKIINLSLNLDLKVFEEKELVYKNFSNIAGNDIIPKDFFKFLNIDNMLKTYKNTCSFKKIYSLVTPLRTNYILICTNEEKSEHIVIGPFITQPIEQDNIYKIVSSLKLNKSYVNVLENYFYSLPVVDSTQIYSICSILMKYLFNLDETPDIETMDFSTTNSKLLDDFSIDFSNNFIEKRYDLEKEFLKAVSNGDMEQAYLYYTKASSLLYFKRSNNPLRDLKTKLFILNTLLRKASQEGGVHPIHLDSISSKYGIAIEECPSSEKISNFATTMIRGYCLQVKNFSLKEYSPYIRKAINYIYINLYNDITVKNIATELMITSDYLSKLFKKELDKSIISYINDKRIKAAIKLLNTTDFSIQEIAMYVGIPDLSYFGKIFKKQVGVSPKKYRENILK